MEETAGKGNARFSEAGNVSRAQEQAPAGHGLLGQVHAINPFFPFEVSEIERNPGPKCIQIEMPWVSGIS